MQKFFLNLVLGLFHLQPATLQTKTFASGIAAIAACVGAACTMIVNGDTNPVDYIAAVAGALVSCGQIFHRDALTKIGNKIEEVTATK
jgi:hypothetical protein